MAIRCRRVVDFRSAIATLISVCALLAACAERPPRFDVAPPSLAPRYVVEVTVSGTPSLTTPVGPVAGAVSGAFVGGYETCVLSYGTLCPAAAVVMPVTAALGIANAETPRNIARARRGLTQQEITSRVGPRLEEAIVAIGNRHRGYRYIVSGDATEVQGTHLALRVTPTSVGLTRSNGMQVFTLHAKGRLENQEIDELRYASPAREPAQWLAGDGADIDAALSDGCKSIAEQLIGRIKSGR